MKKILLIIIALCLLSAGGLSYASTINKSDGSGGLNNGLVGWWTFDGNTCGSTYCLDKSGNNNTASTSSVAGMPLKIIGKIGQGMKYNGSSQSISSSLVTTATNNWTMAAWMNPANLNQIGTVVLNGLDNCATGNGYEFGIGNGVGAAGSKLQGAFGGVGWYDSGYTFPSANKWYHVVMVRDSGTTKFYINASQTANTSASVPITPTNGTIIGSDTQCRYFSGKIDDVRVYNRTLSATEIQQLYSMGGGKIAKSTSQGGLNNGLVGWWTMDGQDCGATYCKNRGSLGGTNSKNVGVKFAPGKIGQGLNINNTVVAPLSISATGGKSFFAWVNPKISGNTLNFQGIFNVYTLFYGTSNQLKYFDGSSTVVSTGTIPPNKWSFVGITYDSATQITFWIDGVASGSRTVATLNIPAAIGFYAYVAAAGNMFSGSIDDVRIYNRALSLTEIQQLYAMGGSKIASSPPSVQNGLVGWWTFDGKDVNATKVLDKSGQGNNGTRNGGVAMTVGKIGQGMKNDGTNDSVSFTAPTLPASGATITGWFKSSVLQNGMLFGNDGSSYPLYFASTITYYSTGGGGVNLGYTPQFDNKWHFASIVRENENSVQLYIDGIGKGSKTTNNTVATLFSSIGGGLGSFNGLIDDVRAYNRALSAQEIQQLYNMGK